ncbi:MAG: hypothetical protein AAGA18_12060 [Verrucomicrobiota bacterium]
MYVEIDNLTPEQMQRLIYCAVVFFGILTSLVAIKLYRAVKGLDAPRWGALMYAIAFLGPVIIFLYLAFM